MNLIHTFIANQLSVQTRRAYTADIRRFTDFVQIPLTEVSEEHVIQFRNTLASKLAPETVNRMLSTVKTLYQWGVNTGHVQFNPALFVKALPAAAESKTPGLSDEDAIRLLDASKYNPKYEAIISILLYLGLRRSELCSILIQGTFSRAELRVERNGTVLEVKGKGNKVRRIPVPKHVEDSINKHISTTFGCQNLPMGNVYLFPARTDPSKPMNPETVKKIVEKLCKKAGIQVVSPHALRATAVSNAIDNGANFVELQYAFGWSNPQMVNRYDKRRAQIKNSAVSKINYVVK